MKPLVSVVILSYNSRRYIEKCLDTLLAQDYKDLEIFVVINGSADGSAELIKEKYGREKRLTILEPGENLWFSRGNNLAIEQSRGDYIFALNQDTVLEPNFVSTLVKAMEDDESLGSASGKLRHYNFSINSKTRILDSTAIEIFKTRRVIDRGQWEVDAGQYDTDREIFGASGAAAMYRKSALEKVKIPRLAGGYEYFDNDFIAYKEDVDLAWRLQLAGYKCRYMPQAVVYHGRTVGRSWPTQFIRFIHNRHRQSRLVRQQSFRNHYLMMVKNEIPEIFWRHIIYISIREFLLIVYSVLFEPFQFQAMVKFFKLLPEARRKRRYIMENININDPRIVKLFH